MKNVKKRRDEIKVLLENRGLVVLGRGGKGNINPVPEGYDEELDYFFRCLYVEKNGIFYCINFMRWEIEKNVLNCYLGEIQCDVTKDQSINHKVYRKKEYLINYPPKVNKDDYRIEDDKVLGVFDPKKYINYLDNEELVNWFLNIISQIEGANKS